MLLSYTYFDALSTILVPFCCYPLCKYPQSLADDVLYIWVKWIYQDDIHDKSSYMEVIIEHNKLINSRGLSTDIPFLLPMKSAYIEI